MAKRGEIARERAKDIICKAFGEDFVTVQDKKIYVMAKDEGGEKVQFAITLTMPKTPIDTGNTYVNKQRGSILNRQHYEGYRKRRCHSHDKSTLGRA